jgi:pimeloyl-ACP methyl ester carboxylesterase
MAADSDIDIDIPEQVLAEEVARRLSNFADLRHHEITGAGHMVHYDRPNELNAVIAEFLATLEQVGA